jgi:hypothetical protein
MSVLLITFDSTRSGQDYSEVLSVLRSYKHIQLAEGSFAIETHEATRTVYNKITKFLNSGIPVYILTVTKPFSGQCGEEIKHWLGSHLPQV